MKIKVLLSSVLSIVLCLTMIAGATYALFTDSETVNIAVTAGKVDIDVTVDKIQTLSYPATDWDDDLKFTNGGFVDYTKDATTNELILDKITPGDAVKVNMNVVNNSDVKIKYRVKVGVTSGLKLFKALDVSIGGVAADYKGMTFVSDWVELNPIAGEDKTFADIALEIKLPYLSESQNDLMGESTTLYYTVQAVQGNASAEDLDAVEDGTTYIYNAIDLELFAENVKNGNTYKGETVQLMSDVDLAGIEWTPVSGFQGTFDGKKTALTSSAIDTLAANESTESTETAAVDTYTIKNLTVKGNSSVGFFANISGGALVQNVTFENANVSGNHYVGVVFGWEGSENVINTVKNVHIVNSAVTCTPEQKSDGTWDNGDKAGAIGGYAVSTNIIGCTVTGTFDHDGDDTTREHTVSAYRDFGGILGYAHKYASVKDCTVENITLTVNSTYNYKNYTSPVEFDANNIVGEAVASAVIEGNKGEAKVWYDEINGVTYYENGGELWLYDASQYTEEVLNIPEGVTVLRNKNLNGNTTIKEVVIPLSLKNFGGSPNGSDAATGGFFYKSAVEKITLPEGMTEIPVGAFNQAANLKEINIPSTVKKIGIAAFGGTGLTELVIPATVEEIGGGAFRDMANLTTVTFAGDIYLPNYAFRSCPSLKSAYLLGANTTFDPNASMIFTVKDSGQGESITIYVANETVKELLAAADPAAKNNIVVMGAASSADELKDAIANGETSINLSAGNYTLPAANGKDITIIGTKDTVINCTTEHNTGSGTITFVGVTIQGINTDYRGFQHSNVLVFENCVIDSQTFLYAEEITFNNCTFNQTSPNAYNVWTYSAGVATFNNCTFNSAGKSVLIYKESDNTLRTVNFNGCTFNASQPVDGKAAIEIDSSLCPNFVVNINNCTANGFAEGSVSGSTLWNQKKGTTAKITIDGIEAVHTAEAMAAALKANKSIYIGANITVEGKWDCRDAKSTAPVVIDGLGHTIKFTGTIDDAGNHYSAFRFEGEATVKNLTVDMSEAKTASPQNKVWAIAAKADLTVDNCTFIGSTSVKGRAIGYGFGTAYDSNRKGEAEISVTNCSFTNWSRAISDNENGQDITTVTVTGNTFTNANVYLSAYESATMTGNTFVDSGFDVRSYTSWTTAKAVVTDNVLDADIESGVGASSKPYAVANVTVQEGVTVYAN